MGARGLVIRDDVGAAELRRFAQGEADRRAALRAVAIAQALEGASRAEAARVVGRERQSLRDAVVRFNAEGLAGLWDRPRPGRPEKLSMTRQEELRAWVLQGPDPEVDGLSSYRLLDIAACIQERWAVSYTLSALSRLLHRMGLSWQTTRPVHPKADAEAQELYKKPRGHAGGDRGHPPRQNAAAVVRGRGPRGPERPHRPSLVHARRASAGLPRQALPVDLHLRCRSSGPQ